MTLSILIAWSDEDRAWLATAIDTGDLSRLTGNTTSDGATPVLALDAMLEKRLLLDDAAFRPTPARVLRGVEDNSWRSASELPHEFETVLVWAPNQAEPVLAWVKTDDRWEDDAGLLRWSPTHWMPLPKAPA